MSQPEIGIFTREDCSWCEQAKALLEDKGLKYKEQKIINTDEKIQLKEKYPKAKTFPVVVIDHKWIGGFTQLMDWLREHKDDLDV